METLQTILGELSKAGIQPEVTLQINLESDEVAKVQEVLAALQSAGTAATVRINLSVSAAGLLGQDDSRPGLPVDKTGPAFTVVVAQDKLNCMTFSKKDGGGKPIMEIREPRVQLIQGTRFQVSATHTAGDKDQGDGTVIGTGGVKYFFVVDCPKNREAEGLYVKQESVQLV